jgi:uncharacterized protein DUF4345
MRSPLRIAMILLGAFFAFQGLLWIADPERAAAGLGMSLLDGVARSTQIGDLSALFLTAGATILVGALPGRARLLYVPMGLFGVAAVARTLAWVLHGAAFAVRFISIELAVAALLLVAARRLGESR